MNAPAPPAMTSSRPYFLRALFEWIVDNNLTPHIIAATNDPKVRIPPGLARDERIVLNIAPRAVRDLIIDAAGVSFVARFAGVTQAVYLPLPAVLGIYARENGVGMLFNSEESEGDTFEQVAAGAEKSKPEGKETGAAVESEPPLPKPPSGAGCRPTLKIVK